jgi:hypothetical protein
VSEHKICIHSLSKKKVEAQAGVQLTVRLNQVLKRSVRLDVLSTLRRLAAPDALERRKLSQESPFLMGNATLEVDPAASLHLLNDEEEAVQGGLIKDDEESAPTT